MVFPRPKKFWGLKPKRGRTAQCTECCAIRKPAIGFLTVAPRETRRPLRLQYRKSSTECLRVNSDHVDDAVIKSRPSIFEGALRPLNSFLLQSRQITLLSCFPSWMRSISQVYF